MAQIPTFDPVSGEIQSPIMAGITEGLNKISAILDMETTVFEQATMLSVYIDTKLTNKNRLYQIGTGQRLWLSSPNPIIRKNGSVINSATDFFEIDYIGGSITFYDGHNLLDTDIVTATITSVNNKSKVIYDILNDISLLKTKASHDKGFFATKIALEAAHPTGINGDSAIVGETDTIWIWDSDLNKWADSHKATDLTNHYTKSDTDNLLSTKEPTISAKGETIADDDYYYGGRKQWMDLVYKIKNTVLVGVDVSAIGTVTELDNIISAIGKLQSQVNATKTSVTQEIADRKQADIETLQTANTNATTGMSAHNTSDSAHANRFDLKADVTALTSGLSLKADSTFVNSQLALKADTEVVERDLSTKADNTVVNSSLLLKADKTQLPIVSLVSIDSALFVADTEYGDYPFRASVPITGVVVADSVDINFNVGSLAIANEAEVASVSKSYVGGVYLYAKAKPSAVMAGTVTIIKGG